MFNWRKRDVVEDIPAGFGAPITGTLHGYWEQGWEGRIEYEFRPDTMPADAGPRFLAAGQHLTIVAPDGTRLWRGVLAFTPRRWWESHALDNGIWHTHKQRGTRYGEWIAYFWQKPPLRAELRLSESMTE
jgi:hypothetical protein